MSRADLRAVGMTPRQITAAVRGGRLIRPRQGCYVTVDAPPALIRAVRVGGRLGCLSLLSALGVFVFDDHVLHVHMSRGDGRLRSPTDAAALPPRGARDGVVLHWHPLVADATTGCVGVVDALIHAVRCQEPRYAIATLDSALDKGAIDEAALADVFAALPRRFQVLRTFVDGRSQAGTETLVRLMLLRLGCRVDLQVWFDDVGFVDLLVDEWLVVECDSKEFHSDWAQQVKDYTRDRVLATRGYTVLRLTAADILYRPDVVVDALRGLIRRNRRP